MDKIEEILQEINDFLIENARKHMEIVDKVDKLLSEIKEQNRRLDEEIKFLEEDNQTKDTVQSIMNDTILADDKDILERRIAYHKQMGTYEEDKDLKEETIKEDEKSDYIKQEDENRKIEPVKEEKIKEEDKLPKISPLMKLSPKERDILYKQIFNEAKYNVEILLNTKEGNSDYEEKLFEESNRLLNNWIEINKTKKRI